MMPNAIVMIRKNLINCKLFQEKRSGETVFQECMNELDPGLEICPCCGSRGSLRLYASYDRFLTDLVDGQCEDICLSVTRLICTGCGHTHSVLPDPVIPYCRHSLRFILRVLAVHAFHLQSVEKICDVFQISVKTFYRWQKVFYEHQDKWQDFLSAAKRDLKAALLELCRKTPFCTFAECFIRKSGHSFLQSHKNPVFPNQKKKLVPNPP